MRTTATVAMGLMMLMAGCRQPMVEVNGYFMPRDEAIRRGLVVTPLSEKERQEQLKRRQEMSRLGQIDVGDVLSVAVDGDPSLNGEYDVCPEGTVEIGYLEPIPVYGMTDAEAAGRIRDSARHFLKEATVRVEHRGDGRKGSLPTGKRHVLVLGDVRHPSPVSYAQGMSAAQALDLAGGLIVPIRVRVVRGGNTVLDLDLMAPSAKDTLKTFILEPGDVLMTGKTSVR